LFAKILFLEKVDTGIDPNGRELQRAKDLGAYEELIQCQGHAVPKPDGSYRTIMSNSVLEHIPDLQPVLREAYRLLAPGGQFYFTVPSDKFEQYSLIAQLLMLCGLDTLARRFQRFFNRFWRHYHCHSVADWKTLAEQMGFVVVDAFSYASRWTCLVNDVLAGMAFPRFVLKRLFNRWVLAPRLRSFLMSPVCRVANGRLTGGGRDDEGGLVFVALTKR
jgi:SAM-dependent methyltransferase